MGGKRKTKWRKLPLVDFTKECPATEKKTSKQEYQTDVTREEDMQNPIPVYEDNPEVISPYSNEYREYPEAVVYTSPYVVYNPVYPSYVMPEDPRCYYYLPPEMAPVQEYAPMPYQEYVPQVKDTVYLLLPAPTLRSPQGFPHITYDWRSRHRRKRYEGYAEYAVISDKTSSSGVEEKDQRKKSLFNARNDNQLSHGRTMTTFSETSSFNRDNPQRIQEPYQKPIIATEEKRTGKSNMAKLNDEKNEYVQEKQNLKSWKNQDFCKVHATRTSGKGDLRNDNFQTVHQEKGELPKNILDDGSVTNRLQPEEPTNFQLKPNISKVNDDQEVIWADECDSDSLIALAKRFAKAAVQTDTNSDSHGSKIMNEFPEIKLSAKEIGAENTVEEDCQLYPDAEEKDISGTESFKFAELPSSLPDILNTLQSSTSKTVNNEAFVQNDETDAVDRRTLANEKKSKSILPQTSYVPHPLNSDSFSNETEAELKKLRMLQSLKANQSIYKLAFDENITDQSNSRSPSPVDPETQVPSSIPNSEILIHEAGSDSEAGSEDVELISHRYESETSLNENKHMYVNKLSLAVELLRTQETLPYDEQFKRVIAEHNLASKVTKKDTTGEVNFAFVEDSFSMGSLSLQSLDGHAVVTTQSEASRHLSNGEVSEYSESCEMAKEVVETVTSPASREGATNRRFQAPFRHYFSPRAMLMNPCSCCIIM